MDNPKTKYWYNLITVSHIPKYSFKDTWQLKEFLKDLLRTEYYGARSVTTKENFIHNCIVSCNFHVLW